MTDLAQIRQATCINGHTGRSLWAFIDSVRKEERVSMVELSRRLDLDRTTLYQRRKRSTGNERLSEIAELFAALGWELTLTANKKIPESCE